MAPNSGGRSEQHIACLLGCRFQSGEMREFIKPKVWHNRPCGLRSILLLVDLHRTSSALTSFHKKPSIFACRCQDYIPFMSMRENSIPSPLLAFSSYAGGWSLSVRYITPALSC